MSPTIRHKCKHFHSTVQRARDRRQKFHFCRLPFHVRPRNVKLNLSIDPSLSDNSNEEEQLEDSDFQRQFRSAYICPVTRSP